MVVPPLVVVAGITSRSGRLQPCDCGVGGWEVVGIAKRGPLELIERALAFNSASAILIFNQ